jgi:hypothetical protein
MWLRDRWDAVTRPVADGDGGFVEHPWRKLMHCPFCAAPWVLLPIMFAAVAVGIDVPGDSPWERIWWFGAAWLGGAYVATYIVIYDGDD